MLLSDSDHKMVEGKVVINTRTEKAEKYIRMEISKKYANIKWKRHEQTDSYVYLGPIITALNQRSSKNSSNSW